MNNTTTIKFKFEKPGGFTIMGKGSFTPKMSRQIDTSPEAKKIHGNTWVEGYDFSHIYSFELPGEKPEPLPEYLTKDYDQLTIQTFRMEQMRTTQGIHASNNLIRNELRYLEGTGMIKVVFDSFHDEVDPTKPTDSASPSFKSIQEALVATQVATIRGGVPEISGTPDA